MPLLFLPCPDPDFNGEPVVLAELCTFTRRLEAAGRSFKETYEIQKQKEKDEKKGRREKDKDEDDDQGGKQQEEWSRKKKATAENSRVKKALDGENLYEVLELDDGASTDDVRKAYRKMALLYHPDKSQTPAAQQALKEKHEKAEKDKGLLGKLMGAFGSGNPDPYSMSEDEKKKRFLVIQEAYEILSDQGMRRVYDSSLPFDESLPSQDDLEKAASAEDPQAAFFKTFVPVFQRNVKWSTRKPAPSLGDMDTPLNQVKKFYDWWFRFSSWRDFGIHEEYDLNDAECREERRWMERKNKKIREKYEIEEKRRITRLTEMAQQRDPRLLAEKAAIQKAREEEKEKKRRAVEEAKEKKRKEEEEARLKKEQEEKEAEARRLEEKKKREEEKKVLRVWRQRVRAFNAPPFVDSVSVVDSDVLQELCVALPLEKLEFLVADLLTVLLKAAPQLNGAVSLEKISDNQLPDQKSVPETARQAVTSRLQAALNELFEGRQKEREEKARLAEAKKAEEKKRKEEEANAAKAAKAADWTPDELSLLAKGLQRHPGGAARRWQLISQMIGTKTPEEVIKKTQEMSQGASLKSMGSKISAQAFEQFHSHNRGAFKDITAAPDERDPFENSSARPAQQKPQTSAQDQTGSGAAVKQKQQQKKGGANQQQQGGVAGGNSTSSSASAPAKQQLDASAASSAPSDAAAAGGAEDQWSPEQQAALEKALAKFPASMAANERWTAISGEVPGKSKKECVARFKEIRQSIMKQQAGGK
uniref:DnaJ homolog subfamily C member 2 n=1 Tax=Chromera velia CCMP2878 TaxID=1169474 RepID=A0A0G4GNF4_9ALVE|mmetsp:Transcript_25408/g.49646  ORF Transcript_25408/g.49646 Transcript_25408/m.49646 type:complete len:760 (+) Transcript_25408:294-2573(+)|eukprot:Cvel_22673.t1-p1 / transcript=Cvel_22673.t1 / gene=Cvel_22673 / organism=Chromera_velia_CCMP2878 / gene_product=DnaJ homolog subfamily C member 2, putative / transcript_product=DnaJ homolog subfamily C member 2, putative / location=Cvel_scaffold2254:12782-18678(-) / protein_length=759 / sequence_SO=supercontig / SO=protein_coding / is_pseudo=false